MSSLSKEGKYSVSFYNTERKRLLTLNYVKKIVHVWNYLKRKGYPDGVLLVYERKTSILLHKFKYFKNGTIKEFN